MSWVRGLDGCWRYVRPVTVERWQVWRLAHPGWHAPLRTALEAGIACGAPAALATALVALPPSEHAGGGVMAGFASTPPGGPPAVGGTFIARGGRELDQKTRTFPPATDGVVPVVPVPVPEPGTLALLGVGALLAVWARRP